MTDGGAPARSAVTSAEAAAPLGPIVDRAVRRQVPLLFAALAVVYANVAGVALVQPELQRDIGLTPAAYGLGATALLLGFLLCAVPSNLLMERIGARWTLGRVLVCMGLGTAALAMVSSPAEHVAVRFVTGVLAAGLSPGLKLYAAQWYPPARRARVFAMLLLAPAVAGASLGAATGALLSVAEGAGGLHAWQWLFLALSAPCFVVAALISARLDDRPSRARWLDTAQRAQLEDALAAREHAPAADTPPRGVLATAIFGRLAAAAACLGFAGGTLTHVVPLAMRRLGEDPGLVGLLTAIPYLAGGLAALAWSRRSDRANERRRHLAAACAAAATGCLLLGFAPGLVTSVAAATLAFIGVLAAVAVYWTVPLELLTRATTALGIGLVQVAYDLGTALAPSVHGFVLQHYGSLEGSLIATAAVLGIVALVLPGRSGSLRNRV